MAGKVWVIRSGPESGREASRAPQRRPASSTVQMPEPSARPARPGRWSDVLTAYLLGPVSSALWLKGRGRLAWNAIGSVAAVAVLVFLLRGDLLSRRLVSSAHGVAPWLAVVPIAIVALVTVWSRSIAAAGRHAPDPPAWLRIPTVVGGLGLLVPGLGFLLIGRARRAARAFWVLAPLAASVAILANWRFLWFRNLTAGDPSLSGPALEVLLAAAAVAVPVTVAVWVSQALDGARLTVPARIRSERDQTGVALLAAIVLFVIAFRPTAAAGCLDAAAARLEMTGFRVLPLALSETAYRLDPAEPRYLARALELDEALGRGAAAARKRRVLEERTRVHLEVVWSEGHGVRAAPARAPLPGRSAAGRTGPQTALR